MSLLTSESSRSINIELKLLKRHYPAQNTSLVKINRILPKKQTSHLVSTPRKSKYHNKRTFKPKYLSKINTGTCTMHNLLNVVYL